MPSLGFGLERIGLPAIRYPVVALVLVALFTAFCAAGLSRLKIDHTLTELFRSSSEAFHDFEAMGRRFPSSEYDLLVVVEGSDLMRPDALEAVRTAHLELQLADAVEGVLSMFSIRGAPDATGLPRPVLPAEIPQGQAFDRLAQQVLAHPLIGGNLLSRPDGGNQLALLVLTLTPQVLAQNGKSAPIREIEAIARGAVAPQGLQVRLAGAPVMQMEIGESMRRDRLIFNGAGFLVGFMVNMLFFRRFKLVLITSICPAVAVVWALGLLGWVGVEISTFINVIPPLVMVIAFTDSMHMVFSIRRNIAAGKNRFSAAREALLNVGPACVLTSLTTAIAFLSLTLADSSLIRAFGFSAALATLFAFVVVIAVVPALAVLMLRDEKEFRRTEKRRDWGVRRLDAICTALANWIPARSAVIAVVGLTIAALFAGMHLQLEPRYRLSDQVPDSKQSVATSELLGRKLTGAYPVNVMIEWPSDRTVASPDVGDAIAAAHRLLESRPSIGNVWSLETIRGWLAEAGQESLAALAAYMEHLPAHLVARFVNPDANSALLTGRMPDLDSQAAARILNGLDNGLEALRGRHPEFAFTVTGLTAVSAFQSSDMIGQLNRGLLVAIFVVIVLIGVAFRSAGTALLAIVPNMFPVVAAGTFIYLTGGGLEYASVIALTVAFGMAVDDTIHFLTRLRVESGRSATLYDAVHETLSKVGPVLMLTTMVLVAGLAVTLLSELPPMRLFGSLFMTTLVAALMIDIVLLPALILALQKLRSARARARAR